MTTMSAEQMEAEFVRLSSNWEALSRRSKSITICRLEELQSRAMGVPGEEELIARIKDVRMAIRQDLKSSQIEQPSST